MNPDKHLHHNAVMVLNGMHDMANKGEITWYGAIVEHLSPNLSRSDVSNALDLLFDFGLVEGHYCQIEKGIARYKYIYKITDTGEKFLKSVHGV